MVSIHCRFRNPDFTGVPVNGYMNLSVFRLNRCTGQSAKISFAAVYRNVEVCRTVIIIDCHSCCAPIPASGKCILAVSQNTLLVVTIGECRNGCADFSKCCNESSTGIGGECIFIVIQVQLWAKRIIRTIFFFPFYAEFGTIIERWNTRKCIQQHMNRSKMCLLIQLCINTFYVMIVYKVIKFQTLRTVAAHFIETLYGMSYFKIIVVVMTGIQSFVQMIVGNRVKSPFIDPAGIITMDHFAHQPEVRFHLICCVAQSLHKIKVQYIRRIQTNTVNIKFADPEANHIADIIFHFRITLIQFYKKIIAAPVFIGKTVIIFSISIKIHIAVPVAVTRLFSVGLNIFKCKKIAAGMIKYTVQNHPDTLSVAFFYKVGQIFIRSQAAVQLLIVRSFITMSHRFK